MSGQITRHRPANLSQLHSEYVEVVSRQATKVTAVACKLEWRIEQFEKLMRLFKNGVSIVSNQFSSTQAPSVVWELHVYPNGKREEDHNTVSFFLRQVGMQEGTEPLTSEFQIFALNAQNSRVSICRDTKDFVHQQGRGKFQVTREKMIGAAHMDGSIVLMCDAEFLHPDSKISAIKEFEEGAKQNADISAENSVRTSNRELFEDKLFADCKIQVDTATFMAHRCILGQNSRVFRSMFSQSAMIEAQNGTVVIDGARSEHFRALLEFVYCGSISASDMDNFAQGILAIADKYEIMPLKKQCEMHLASKITDENVGELAVVADTFFAQYLKKSCMRYLATHHKEIIRSGGWKELKRNRSQLVNELLESVLDGNMDDDNEEGSQDNCSGKSNGSAKKMRKF